jgi:endonuclease/exonuclease/phosphatase family metal-dependent hydrolase
MSNKYANLRRLRYDRRLEGDAHAAAVRCAERLLKMRESLDDVRSRKSDGSLLLATWNIRDFDSNKFKYGYRLPETFFYIAEIISCFDLVALQEVNRDLSALNRVMEILGGEWDYIVTDTTAGSGGNNERMAFVYNTEKVWFRKIAGEVVLPSGQLVVPREMVRPPDAQPDAARAIETPPVVGQQFARTPFLVAFQSGWFRFSLCTVHIYYGAESGEQLERRIAEIKRLVKFFADRQDDENKQELDRAGVIENYILLGDFNVVSPEHRTMQALKSEGFTVPAAIDGAAVREEGDHFYDQIAVRVKDERFDVAGGGLINIWQDVFRDNDTDRALYDRALPEQDPEADHPAANRKALYLKWRTWQMSDHKPLWIEIKTD